MDKISCPSCGREIKVQPHPERPWRVVGFCECHPEGAVIETNFVAPDVQRKPEKIAIWKSKPEGSNE